MATPSLKNAQHQTVREVVDAPYIEAVRRLEASYYGTPLTVDNEGMATSRAKDGWRNGINHPFEEHDLPTDPADAKALFDKLHGLIWHQYREAFDVEAKKQGLENYDPVKPNKPEGRQTKLARAQVEIARLEAEGFKRVVI